MRKMQFMKKRLDPYKLNCHICKSFVFDFRARLDNCGLLLGASRYEVQSKENEIALVE